MKEYIDKGALYDKTAEWEASAFAYIEKLNRTPLEEMSEDELAEWRKWTAILSERIAFKFDVADEPTVDVRENVHAHWIFKNDNIAIPTGYYECSGCGEGKLINKENFCPNCGAVMDEGREDD